MFDPEHPAYISLQKIGREITQKIKPRAVVVFSAHWQAGPSHVEVNTAEVTDLIYDYYNFPAHYYKVKYPNVGSKSLGEDVIQRLQGAGIDARPVKRGLDHGVFASFTVMFRPDENPLGVPLVQVSLYDNENPDKHFELGEAIKALREDNVLMIGSGMAVHNLRDFFGPGAGQSLRPYVKPFDELLKNAVVDAADAQDRKEKLRDLLEAKEARSAHPTFEHLFPIHIAAGAAGDDKGIRTFAYPEVSMSWSQFRFGDLPVEA